MVANTRHILGRAGNFRPLSPLITAAEQVVAREPLVERVFVNAAIKRALCREGGPGRAWMAKIRPWWGHNYHFHVRLGTRVPSTIIPPLM